MSQLRKTLTILLTSALLVIGMFFSTGLDSLAAITPPEAQKIINDADSPQEAGARLRQSDSSDKVRNREPLDTAKEVTDRIGANTPDRREPLIRDTQNKLKDAANNVKGTLDVDNTQNKLKGAAENIKEKLNLDEPIPQSTKDFGNDVKNSVNNALGK
jgi:hypothetical protein